MISETIPFDIQEQHQAQHLQPTQIDSSDEVICRYLESQERQVNPDSVQCASVGYASEITPCGMVPLKMVLQPGVVTTLQVHHSVLWGEFLALWQFQFFPAPDFPHHAYFQPVSAATLQQYDIQPPDDMQLTQQLLSGRHQDLGLMVWPLQTPDMTWKTACQLFPVIEQFQFDAIGSLSPDTKLGPEMWLSSEFHPCEPIKFNQLHAHLANTQIHIHQGTQNDDFFCAN